MRYWQKIFLSMLLIFIIVFDAGVYTIVSYSNKFNLERETESSVREQEMIAASISGSVKNAESIFSNAATNKERLTAIVQPLDEYYRQQGVFLSLYNGEEPLYILVPVDERLLSPKDGEENIQNGVRDGKHCLFISSKIAGYPHLTFVYARDISRLDALRFQMNQVFIVLNIIVFAVLGAAVFFVLRRMTKPIGQLSRAAKEITEGAYDRRVEIKRGDELGELADTFNLMAASVEGHIGDMEKLAEDKQTFINNLSHEMKTPLTSVLGYSEYLLKANSTDEERAAAAENLHFAAVKLHDLSQKMREIVFLSEGDINKENVSVSALFDAVRRLSGSSLQKKNITLTTEPDGFVPGDEALLLSLFCNLVENAANASKSGQTVILRASQSGDTVTIEVADAGCGISPEEIEKITDPFYRVDKSRSRKEGGIGLGLSICQKIAALHGAPMSFHSKPDEGTIVRIDFTIR